MIEIYIDAASAGNPGPSAIGIFIKNGKDSKTIAKYIGTYSNHEAEFIALKEALNICTNNHWSTVSIKTDSKLVSDAYEKKYVKNTLFQPLLKEIIELSHFIPLCFIQWVPSTQNKVADQLARSELIKWKNK